VGKTYSGPVYVLQVAQIGGAKLGFEDDPEGTWVDHNVFLDRDLAEAEARLHETAPVIDAGGQDISSKVTTVARVITYDELVKEFGDDRGHVLLTMFRERFSQLFDALPDDDP
jgi:hypothetical protein